MKEQDAAHSFDEWTYEKDIHGTAYAFYRCNDFEFKAAITNPESLADQLNELTRLRSELQQERELRKELVEAVQKLLLAKSFRGGFPHTTNLFESLIEKQS